MVDDELGPGDFSTRGIPTARRGYEKKAVDALVAGAFARWAELHRRYTELLEEVGKAGGVEHLGRDLGALGGEIGELLEAAHEAATGLRDRAWESAQRLEAESKAQSEGRLSAAAEEAARLVDEAEQRAQSTVAEAEERAFQARKDAWETGVALLEQALAKAAAIIADAEQQVLIMRAEGEREVHRRLAQSRKEAEEVARAARHDADRQLSTARELIKEILEIATEQGASGWDEENRDRLLAEIDLLRAERAIGDIAVVPAGSKATPAQGPSLPDPGAGGEEAGLSEVLVAEVKRLRDTLSPSSEVEAAGREGEGAGPADIESLFDSLRTTSGNESGGGDSSDVPVPVSQRDRAVLPHHNSGLREVKRRLVDLQERAREVLEAGGSPPSPHEIVAELAPLLESVVQKAAAAGNDAARSLTGVAGGVQPGPRPTQLVERMAQDLASQVRNAVSSSADGPTEAAASVGRVFRAWRTDQAERWVRTVTYSAYHDALLAGLARGGVALVRAVAHGAPCQGCPGPARLEWAPGADPPNGTGVPPVEVDCLCTFEPVES